VWPGVTVEHAEYTWRLDELVKLESAGRRWVSYEPVLGRVDFARWLGAPPSANGSGRGWPLWALRIWFGSWPGIGHVAVDPEGDGRPEARRALWHWLLEAPRPAAV